MGRDMVVSRYAIPIGIPHIDGLSTEPLGFGVSQTSLAPFLKLSNRYSHFPFKMNHITKSLG